MSAPEVAVLNAKLDTLIEDMVELKQQNKAFSERLYGVEGKVTLLNAEHCRIQEAKKDARKPWYSIIPGIVQALTIAALIYAMSLRN